MKGKKINIFVMLLVLVVISIFFAFNYNKIMKSYALPDNWYESYSYTLDDENSNIILTKYNEKEADVEVPSTVIISEKKYEVLIDGGVYSNNKDIKTVTFENGVRAGTSLRRLFYSCSNLETIVFNNFNTENVTSMESMFHDCKSLKTLDLSSFDTSKVINMKYMFWGCIALKLLNVTSFNTSELIDMTGMFHSLSHLTTLDLSSFDTTNVTEMMNVFNGTSSLKEITLGAKTNLKIGVLSNAGNFGRGTWKRVSDGEEFSAVQIGVNSTSSGVAAGTYRKISNVSSEFEIDFPVTYKIEKITKIDEFIASSDSNFYMDDDKHIYATVPLSNTSTYLVPGTAELLFKNVVSDATGNKYNLKLVISNIKLHDLNLYNGVDNVIIEVVSLLGNAINFNHLFINPNTGSTININSDGVSREQDVEIQIVDDKGVAQDGYYIFSAYDLDVAGVGETGYGINSEGINFISGFDTDNIKLASTTFLQLLISNNYKRITGSRIDNESESSEFLVKADANSSKFQWTVGKSCGTRFLVYYQPQLVEIVKTNIVGENLSGIGFELYKDNEVFATWETTNESKKIFLNPGKYTLKEVKMPSYFEKAKDIDFYVDINDTLTVDGKTVEKVVMRNEYKDSAGVIEKHIDEYDNKLLDNEKYNGKINAPYETKSKEFDGYRLVKEPSNSSGLMKEELIEVIYYYRKVFNVITQVDGIGGTIVGDEEILEGNDTTPNKIVITPNENFVIDRITINGEEIEITNKKGMTLPYFGKLIEDKRIVVSFVEFLDDVPSTGRTINPLMISLVCGILGIIFIYIAKMTSNKTKES